MPPAVGDVPNPLGLLAGSAIFEGLKEADLERLLPSLRVRSFGKDSYLFREGDPGSHLYLVVRGEVLEGQPQRRRQLMPARGLDGEGQAPAGALRAAVGSCRSPERPPWNHAGVSRLLRGGDALRRDQR